MFGKWADGLAEALRRSGGTHTLEDVAKEIQGGRAQYWPSEQCCVVTVVCQYPQRRLLRIWLVAGEWEALERALSVADEIARNFGCDGVEIEGRRGWARRLVGYGYKLDRVVLTKEV